MVAGAFRYVLVTGKTRLPKSFDQFHSCLEDASPRILIRNRVRSLYRRRRCHTRPHPLRVEIALRSAIASITILGDGNRTAVKNGSPTIREDSTQALECVVPLLNAHHLHPVAEGRRLNPHQGRGTLGPPDLSSGVNQSGDEV